MILQYTYATLAAALQDWPEDDDADFVAAIPEIIGHGELKLTRDLDLEIFDIDTSTPITSGSNSITKPASVIAARTLSYTNAGQYDELDQRTIDYVRQHAAGAVTGRPRYYAELNQTQWIVSPVPNFNGTLAVRALARATGLNSSVPSSASFFSNYFADLLLKACLISAQLYLKGDSKWAQMLTDYAGQLPNAAAEVGHLRKKNAVARNTLEGFTQLNQPPAEDQAQR